MKNDFRVDSPVAPEGWPPRPAIGIAPFGNLKIQMDTC
jgi:hypothetical protein